MITRREFCVELAATVAVSSPLSLSAALAEDGLEERLDSALSDWDEDLDDLDIDNESKEDLAYRYLDMLETEGVLNDVIFNRPDWDDDPEGRYTMEYHGVERLIKMVPDDVLLRNFGERTCLCE